MANEVLLTIESRKADQTFEQKDANGNLIFTSKVWQDYPVGQVVDVKTEIDTRREWIQWILGHHPAFTYTLPNGKNVQKPDTRTRGFGLWKNMGWNAAQWAAIRDCWTEARYDAYFKARTDDNKTSRVAKEIALFNDIKTVLQLDDVGKNPKGDRYLTDIYPWNPSTRKRKLIVVNDDITADIAKGYESAVETTQDISSTEKHILRHPAKYIDWVNDLGISAGSVSKVIDPDFEYHPKYHLKIAATKFKTPVITKW